VSLLLLEIGWIFDLGASFVNLFFPAAFRSDYFRPTSVYGRWRDLMSDWRSSRAILLLTHHSTLVPSMEHLPKSKLRVLFVCAMNQWRSPTAEHLYRSDSRLEVRSAGIRKDAKKRLSETDLLWADVVFVMGREQKSFIVTQFRGVDLPPIENLEITDEFQYMDPRLQEALRLAIDPEIALLLSGGENFA